MASEVRGRVLAINEWLFSDLLGENGHYGRSEASIFLLKLIEGPDRILFPKSSPWAKKTSRLSKTATRDKACRAASRLLFGKILFDSAKAVVVHPENTPPLAPDQESRIPEEDRYLVRSALAAGADVLVTTDQALLDGINQSNFGIREVHRDEFLKKYLEKGSSVPQEKKAP